MIVDFDTMIVIGKEMKPLSTFQMTRTWLAKKTRTRLLPVNKAIHTIDTQFGSIKILKDMN